MDERLPQFSWRMELRLVFDPFLELHVIQDSDVQFLFRSDFPGRDGGKGMSGYTMQRACKVVSQNHFWEAFTP